jgi:exosortase K
VAEQQQSHAIALPWWAVAVGVAAALKLHFSAAAASELAWMLRPLTVILRTTAGWHFLVNAAGEWECPDAGIVLVKACAGINFMVLSFLGWCWALRPIAAAQGGPQATNALPSWARLAGALLVALLAAWATALVVNAARILVIVRWQPVLAHWLPAGDAHRLLGLLAYLPALALQGWLVERGRPARALLVACGVYAGLMLGVPLLTGNALADPVAFAHHALFLLAVLVPVLLLAAVLSTLPLKPESVQDRRQSGRDERGSHEYDGIGGIRGVARVPRGCGRR